MEGKKKRKGFLNFFGFDEFFDSDMGIGELTEGGGSYSISVTYDGTGKPVVHVKTQGNIDKEKLREAIEKQYPGAKIIGLEKKPLIRFVDEEKG